MSWQDRDYAGGDEQRLGRPGGDWRGMRPTFDNPITWALSLFRVARITVRVHIFFIIFIVIMLLRSLMTPGEVNLPEFKLTALAMGSLFLIVLLHEFGHCFACRWSGGEADEILMWPLGGLAYCRPQHHWCSHMITVVGGPMVNVVICLSTGIALAVTNSPLWGVVIPNPVDPFGGLAMFPYGSWSMYALFLVHATSFILLLFNLLPIFPLDGGRIVQAALWSRYGYSRSMTLAVRAGYIGAFALIIFGAVTSQWIVVGIAIFGFITCYHTQRQLQWTDAELAAASDDYALSLHQGSDESESVSAAQSRREQKQAQREQAEAQEVDRILQKIAETGIDSLSRTEKGLLRRVTERKRQQGGN